jgi:hypothetical protein
LSAPIATGGFRTAPGVAENRGIGPGCTTPSITTKVDRATLCGWRGASVSDRTA